MLRIPLLACLASVSIFAVDVNPKGTSNVGILKVIPPQGITIHVQSTFTPDDKSLALSTADYSGEHNLRPGKGCLTVESFSSEDPTLRVTTRQCGVEIHKGKTLKVMLGYAKLKWDYSKVQVGIGPQAQFQFGSAGNPSIGMFTTDNATTMVLSPSQLFTFAALPGDYEITYLPKAISDYRSVLQIVGKEETTLDITPPDARSRIVITREKAKYPKPMRKNEEYRSGNPYTGRYFANLIELTHMSQQAQATKKLSGLYAKFKTNDDGSLESASYFAYPLDDGMEKSRYELSANRFTVPLALTPGQSIEVPLAAINVDHIDGKLPGYYRLSVKVSDDSKTKLVPTGWFKEETDMRNLKVSSFWLGWPFNSTDATHYFQTQTSLHVPRGKEYVVETFRFDELGEFISQSVHEIDLTE